ncbi:hypothetical protein QJ48_19065 [Paenibacillus sp. A3]|uniref:PfkB family carbohydrate kinase n=1 Tax=Paenibacillus sp. A3 TaxID=1337054 RepID=UPI0006D52E71|nr:PfkB family carbohydrate kinase [Paenibacillus sp. A3]KPV57989.1 hypothetical protein QJ48_19065 [Paenibacillus sp. A3]
MKLIGVGDNVVDFFMDRGEMFPGGNALNVAVLSKRCGAEQCAYMGIIGNDEAGDHVLRSLRAEGIDVSRIRRAYGPNGLAVVALDEQGDRRFVRSNKGGVQKSMTLRFTEEDLAYLGQFDVLHTSVYSYVERDLPLLSGYADLSFDFSTKRDPDYLRNVCPNLKYAFFSGSDLTEAECGKLIADVHAYGTSVVGVTRGGHGAMFSSGGRLYKQAIAEANVVDTLGAGDSFIAAFLTAYGSGAEMQEALRFAAEAAARTCAHYGAFGYGVPYKE